MINAAIKSVVLISVDDLRADCISCEPHRPDLERYRLRRPVHTPAIDQLAEEGVRFRQCISVSSYTPPAHASMLTGVYPWRHGVCTFYERLAERVPTLAEYLADAGFHTAAYTEHAALRALDITRGFETTCDHTDTAAEVFFDTLREMRRGGRPCFAFLHLFDPHSPYFFLKGRPWWQSNQEYWDRLAELFQPRGVAMDVARRGAEQEARRVVADFGAMDRYMQALAVARSAEHLFKSRCHASPGYYDDLVSLYVDGVNRFDQVKLAAILDQLMEIGLMGEDSVVVLTADHGEAQHVWNGVNYFSNGIDLYEGHLRVPLIIRAPGLLPAGTTLDTQVSLTDIMPTILGLLGRETDAGGCDGCSLVPLATGRRETREPSEVYSAVWVYRGGIDQFGHNDAVQKKTLRKTAVRSGGYKYECLGLPRTPDTTAAPAADADTDLNGRAQSLGATVNERPRGSPRATRLGELKSASGDPGAPGRRGELATSSRLWRPAARQYRTIAPGHLAFVQGLYERHLGRFAATAELVYWLARLRTTGLSRDELAEAIAEHVQDQGFRHRLLKLDDDPSEKHNLAGMPEYERELKRLQHLLRPVQQAIIDMDPGEATALTIEQERQLEERLRALGYL